MKQNSRSLARYIYSSAATEVLHPFMARKKNSRSKCLDGDEITEVCVYHCCKRCASKRQTRYLHPYMFSKILLHLPSQGSHGVMRHFCREWNLMIRAQNRIHGHLRNSSGGVIIQEKYSPGNGYFVEMRRGCLEICKFDCGFGDLVWSSSNGLVLAPDRRDPHSLSVFNPLTKQHAVLPPSRSRIGCYSEFSLAFVEASMEYKVVHTRDPKGRIAVLTIGVDSAWRHIDIEYLCLKTRGAYDFGSFVTGGYIHWTSFDFVLTLNVKTETIRRFPTPRLPKGGIEFLQIGRNLSIFHESSKFFVDVWEMNPETGEWTMLLSFDLKPLKDLFSQCWRPIFPIGWLVEREVLLLTTSYTRTHCIVAYNVKTREIQSVELDSGAKLYHFQAHVNSLLWMERGFQVDKQRKR